MVPVPRHFPLERIVAPFADLQLRAELPRLPAERRQETVEFVGRRVRVVPSFTRFGVAVIALAYRLLLTLPGGPRLARVLAGVSLPVIGEYPRLVRSLGFAYVWDRWPDTLPDGAPR